MRILKVQLDLSKPELTLLERLVLLRLSKTVKKLFSRLSVLKALQTADSLT